MTKSRSDWQQITLSELVDSNRGISYGVVQPGQHISDGIPILRVNNIKNGRILTQDVMRISPDIEAKHSRTRLKGGEVLITIVGTVGDTAIATSHEIGWNVARAVAVIPPRGGVSAKWIQICLSSKNVREKIFSRVNTTVQTTLNLKDIAQLDFPLPPDKERMAIERIICALNDKIELNRRMNATLEAMARALFKSWFVDFDPVRAKMEGKQPFGMDSETAAMFPSRLAPSEHGDIPEGWEYRTFEKIAKLNSESWNKSSYPDSIEYVDLANTKWGVIESTIHHASQDAPSRAQRILTPGDTIVGTVRPGNGSYSFISVEGLTGSTGFAVLSPIKRIYREILYYAATTADNIDRLSHLADGGAYPAVSNETVLTTPLIFSGEKIIAEFSAQAYHWLNKVEENKRENKSLAALRDYLLPRLISGDIRICDAEKFVEAA